MAGSSLWKSAVELAGVRRQNGSRAALDFCEFTDVSQDFGRTFEEVFKPASRHWRIAKSKSEIRRREVIGGERNHRRPNRAAPRLDAICRPASGETRSESGRLHQVAGRIRSNPSRILRVNWRWDRADEAKHHPGNRPAPFGSARGPSRHSKALASAQCWRVSCAGLSKLRKRMRRLNPALWPNWIRRSSLEAAAFGIARTCMTGTIFVDSNILIYAHDLDAGAKQLRAAACLRELWDSGSGRMSTQVLQEFCVNVTRKILRPLKWRSSPGSRAELRLLGSLSHHPCHRDPRIGDRRNLEAVLLGQHDRCRR